MNSMNMSIGKLNIASGLAVEKIGANNLDIYIPRINERYTENEIKFIFFDIGIGIVNYIDFVATKDPETKEIKYYSAFIRLVEWKQDGYWYNKIIVEKLNKISITRNEFWMILPAKTPLARSKVNTHQLAAYTDELFVRVEEVEKRAVGNVTVSSAHFQNLLAKSEEQANQIEKLMKIVQVQAEQLARINNRVFDKEPEETIRPRALTIEDLSQDVEEEQLNFHESVCEKESPADDDYDYDADDGKRMPSNGWLWEDDDDDCFLSKPLSFQNFTETVDTKRDIIRGSFSIDLDDILDPLAKSLGITKEQAEKQLQKEIAYSKRAVGSRTYCGNE